MNSLDGFNESFLGHRVRNNPSYGFIPHFEYFLDNKHRWKNATSVLSRVLASVPTDSTAAWETWRQFRSAQAEITSIFLVESSFQGRIDELEVAKPGATKSCDICASFPTKGQVYIEVKAQSGQQHGDKHPLHDGPIGFTPQTEDDLRSWLFEPKISSKTGRPMKPYCCQAAEKSADVLLGITDIFFEQSKGFLSLGRILSPDCIGETCKSILGGAPRKLVVVEAGKNTSAKMCGLKEVWLVSCSRLGEVLELHAQDADPVLSGTA